MNFYYEKDALNYELGKYLHNKYKGENWEIIENHNNIEKFRNMENKEFPNLKKKIIVGIRKTHVYRENHKSSDFLVPYTSSGCTASCLYCYLVCNYNKCAYLRLFVNREEMLNKIIKTSNKSDRELTFEIGSNSDLILENIYTNNLVWTIEEFAKNNWGYLTFPTKFHQVDALLNLKHGGKTIIRVSFNPEKIIKEIELGTSSLKKRVGAINKLCDAGYKIGIIIAPIILLPDYKKLYEELFIYLKNNLSKKVISEMFIEVIFMSYSYIHRMINTDAFNKDLYDKNLMTGTGKKYYYKKDIKEEAQSFIENKLNTIFDNPNILYIV